MTTTRNAVRLGCTRRLNRCRQKKRMFFWLLDKHCSALPSRLNCFCATHVCRETWGSHSQCLLDREAVKESFQSFCDLFICVKWFTGYNARTLVLRLFGEITWVKVVLLQGSVSYIVEKHGWKAVICRIICYFPWQYCVTRAWKLRIGNKHVCSSLSNGWLSNITYAVAIFVCLSLQYTLPANKLN